jgi:glutamine synthetase
MDGVENGLVPMDEVSGNIFTMNEEERRQAGIDSLPGTLYDAIKLMREDKLITGVLGEHITSRYVAGKLAEWDEFRTQITDWELNKYMIIY